MAPDAAALIWDALAAAERVSRYTAGKNLCDYEADDMLRSAVERQLEIVGEALNKFHKIEPNIAVTIPELRQAISLRNILIHGYGAVNNRLVWDVVSVHLHVLSSRLSSIVSTP